MTTPNGPRPRARGPTFVIVTWAVCMATFVIVYSTFTSSSTTVDERSFPWAVGGLVFVWLVGYLAWLQHAAKRFNVENNAALAALGRGDLESAMATYVRWEQKRVPRAVRTTACHNVGWTLMRQGRLQRAAEVFALNDPKIQNAYLRTMSALDTALVRALLGELETATEWLREADERAVKYVQPAMLGTFVLVRAIIACREGRHSDAVVAFEERWTEHEANMQGSVLRPMRVVRAYAHGAGDARNAGVMEHKLESLRPIYPEEFAFMGVAWPEMATFLAAHGLAQGT